MRGEQVLRLYLKNSKAGARVRRVFIESCGFDNIDLANDIFGDRKEKVLKKLEKKFSLRVSKDSNNVNCHPALETRLSSENNNNIEENTNHLENTEYCHSSGDFNPENTNNIDNPGSRIKHGMISNTITVTNHTNKPNKRERRTKSPANTGF